MNPWDRQRVLARTTLVWAAGSMAAGAALARHPDPWWRAFGQQHLGWGVIDVAIVAVAHRLQAARMRGLVNPYGPAELEHEARTLRRVLLVNVAADAAYVVGGVVLCRGRADRPRAAGAGAAIAVQGAFLLAHDAYHAAGVRVRRPGERRPGQPA